MKFLTMHMKTNKKELTFTYIYIYKGREIWSFSQIHSGRGGEFNNVSMGL
jgi:hypothetical protein